MKSDILFFVIAAMIMAACGRQPVKKANPDETGVKLSPISPVALSVPILSTGILISSEESKLSFKTGGIVAKITVREGDRVRKGDILATLNLSEITAQVDLATAGYDKALRDYNRTKNLFADSVATLEQMQNAATALNAAKSTLDIARFNLTHSEIIAPDNGVILKQFVNTNELTASGYPVFLFGSSGKNWKVKTGISDRDIVRINPGDSAEITMDAWKDKKFPAIVDQVGEMANPLTGTYEVEMDLSQTGYRLAAGFISGVKIFPEKKETYIMVPVGAVVEADGDKGYIYSVSDSMRAQKIKIEIVTTLGSEAAVKGNLNGVREVVSEGAAYLRDGVKVKIRK